MTNTDVNLIAYLALNEVLNNTTDKAIAEDISSKMRVHSKKITSNNPNIVLKV